MKLSEMDGKRINVLIVDDDVDLLKICSSYLRLFDLNVVGTASNGFEALEILKDSITKPDVIVIDYHMPEINGIETSKRILKIDSSDIPIIIPQGKGGALNQSSGHEFLFI